jgi:hypothetical protein
MYQMVKDIKDMLQRIEITSANYTGVISATAQPHQQQENNSQQQQSEDIDTNQPEQPKQGTTAAQ